MKKKVLRIVLTILPAICLIATYLFVAIPFSSRKNGETGDDRGYQGAYFAKASERSPAFGQSKSYKGGVVFIEPNATYTMNGGSIRGKSRTFGGAVYVSEGATFTMNAGVITDCSATYGGAIYVESGGNLVINGGTISGNSANYGPSIYLESGATLIVTGGVFDSNGILTETLLDISNEEINVGYGGEDCYTRYVTLGSYPQTVAGPDMQEILNNWSSGEGEPLGLNNGMVYTYTDGNVYVNDQCFGGYSFGEDGEVYAADGDYLWFKVEPIKWWIINYEGYDPGMTDFWLLSEQALFTHTLYSLGTSSEPHWYEYDIRGILNTNFYDYAFTDADKELIALSSLENNNAEVNDYTDGSGSPTEDNVFLLSKNEVGESDVPSGNLTIFYRGANPYNLEVSDYSNLMLNGWHTGHWALRTGVLYEYDGYTTSSLLLVDTDFMYIADSPFNTGSQNAETTYIRPSIKLSI